MSVYDDDDLLSGGAGLLLVLWKKEKNGIRRKTTSLTVVCNHSPKPKAFVLSMIKEDILT